MNKLKKILFTAGVLIFSIMFFGCGGEETGSVTINMTDAPVDDADIKAVNITVNSIAYHVGDEESEDGWVNIDLDEPTMYNLLELTGGTSEMLGEFTLPAGKITQLRFILDAPVTGGGTPENPGCYLVFEGDSELETDDITESLFVPSGGNSGFKAVGEFDVPVNGSVTLTADFDARKSVRRTGGGSYKLQPTIRLIVNDEAGTIRGTVVYTGSNTPVVYAYEDGTYDASELEADNEGLAFPNAVSSFSITDTDEDTELDFTLAFLAAGTYDLVFIELDADGVYVVDSVNTVEDVVVESKGTTVSDFTYPEAEL